MRIKENLPFEANDYAGNNEYALVKDTDSHYTWAAFSLIGTIIASIVGIIAIASMLAFGVVVLSLAAFLLYEAIHHFSEASKKEAFNKEAFVFNILKKYNIGEVSLEGYGVTTSAAVLSLQKIHVIVDGQAYLFYVSQNAKTGEPTLSDPPINGGAHALTPTVSAKDLLKTKTEN